MYFTDFESKLRQYKVEVILVKLPLSDLLKLEHLSEHQFLHL